MKKGTMLFIVKATLITLVIYNISDYLFLRKVVADLVSRLLTHIGVDAPSYFSGGELMLGDYLFSKNCIAGSVLSVVFGLLFSCRGKLREVAFTSLAIFFVVSSLNIARLITTYYLLSRHISFFWAHDVLANGSAILLAFVVFWIADSLFPAFKPQVFDVLDDIEGEIRGLLHLRHPNL